jgi:simple sugar transport system ATP-binding protein
MKIEIKNISKTFGDLAANSEINISIDDGIHALLGENGAGKSTLVKIISGQIAPDKGEILIDGKNLVLGSPVESINNGVGLLNQDPLDFGNLSVLETFLVGIKDKNPYRNLSQTKENILTLFEKYKIHIDFSQKTNSLSIGERQQIELLRLLYNGAKLIILDEPTSAFSLEQKKMMFDTLRSLTEEGIIIIFVSHKLDEIIELCDSGTILKSGAVIHSITKPFDSQDILEKMFENSTSKIINDEDFTNNRNFNILVSSTDFLEKNKYNLENKFPYGSVIGVAGLQGSSNDTYIKNFFTNEFSDTKLILDSNTSIPKKTYYYMPSDRIEKGLFRDLNVLEHFGLFKSSESKFLSWNKIKKIASSKINEFNIRARFSNKVSELSGGNQQRLMLSLIPENQSILLLEQPTRGLDFNSAQNIWEMILSRKSKDIAILFSSTDIDEIWDYSDIVMSVSGKFIVNIDYKKKLSKEKIINYVSGIS